MVGFKFFKKVKKEGEEEKFSIKDLNKFTDCQYKDTPFIFFVKNNINSLLPKIISKISDEFMINVGIELEFFSKEDFAKISDNCKKFCVKNNIKILNFTKECVKNQYEIQFDIYNDLFLLVEHVDKLKQFLIDNFGADFRAKPSYFNVGSALQVNISLTKDGKNIFGEIDDSSFLQKSVNGLIYYTNYFLPFYIKNDKCLDRYEEEFNKYINDKGLIPAPSFNSCGFDNRTASIRIPTPKNFRDRDGYLLESRRNKRIEFRVPSSDSELKLVLYGVLTSIYIGLKNDLEDVEFTSNNLFMSNYKYKRIFFEKLDFGDIKNRIFEEITF
jgi:glutamine synthetase